MYGTVARMRVNPGMAEELQRFFQVQESTRVLPGMIATYVYQLDGNPDEYYMATVFESKEAYHANASSPEQDQSYHRLRALLASDPEWHDGAITAHFH